MGNYVITLQAYLPYLLAKYFLIVLYKLKVALIILNLCYIGVVLCKSIAPRVLLFLKKWIIFFQPLLSNISSVPTYSFFQKLAATVTESNLYGLIFLKIIPKLKILFLFCFR